MLKFQIRARGLMIALILAVLLTVSITLAVLAQEPERDADAPLDRNTEIFEEELDPLQIDEGPKERDSNPAHERINIVEEEEVSSINSKINAPSLFQFISANTFVPYDDDMTYNYSSGGCMYRTGGGNYTEHTLQLPQGAEIDYLRVYFYDNDPTHDATAYLFLYDGQGGSTSLASVSSSGSADYYRSEGSGYFSHIVDNIDGALSLSLYFGGGTTSDLRICGVRIRYQYQYPVFGAALPVIQK